MANNPVRTDGNNKEGLTFKILPGVAVLIVVELLPMDDDSMDG